MPDVHIHGGTVTVNLPAAGWTDASSIDIKREGDTITVQITLADGQHVPVTDKAVLVDGAGIRIPLVAGSVRVKDEEPEPIAQGPRG